MTAPTSFSPIVEPELLDDTVEMLLDTHSAVTEALGQSMPLADLEELLRELTVEIVDVYRIVAADSDGGGGSGVAL
ncbi:MAG: hypothetical protein AAGD35_16060 [Actinomycetota bacterium]